MQVRVVELPVNLARLDFSQCLHFFVYPESLLAMVTTALLSSMMMAGSSRGICSSWQIAMRKLSSLARVKRARVSACVEEVATAVCLTLRL